MILVLGMHRSGLSAAAGVLSALGVGALGDLVADALGHQPRLGGLADFNEGLLGRLGSAWDDPAFLDDIWRDTAAGRKAALELQTLLETTWPDTPLVFLQDPRLCRLAPLWLEALKRLDRSTACLLVCRHPFEVAGSLQVRDGLPRMQAMALWLSYVLEAEVATRGELRTFLLYPDLVEDWYAGCTAIARDLELSWPRDPALAQDEIGAVLRADLRRHRVRSALVDGPDPLSRLVAEAWAAVQKLAVDREDGGALAALDAVRTRYREASALLGPLLTRGRENLARLRAEFGVQLAESHAEGRAIAAERDDLRQRGEQLAEDQARADVDHETRIGAVEGDRRRIKDELQEAQRRLQTAHSDAAATETRLSSLEHEVQRARDELQGATNRLRLAEHAAQSDAAAAEASRAALRKWRAEHADALDEGRARVLNEVAAQRWGDRTRNRIAAAAVTRSGIDWSAVAGSGPMGELEALRAASEARHAHIQAIHASWSWRAMSPFRAARRTLRGELTLRDLATRLGRPVGRPAGGAPAREVTSTKSEPIGWPATEEGAAMRALDQPVAPSSRRRVPFRPAAPPEPRSDPFPLPNFVTAASELLGVTEAPVDAVVSVIIPTYNAGAEFYWLLRKLKAQKGLRGVEIVVVDSGSSDGTLELCKQMGCVVVHCDKRDFSHSRNRNIGADHATGELLLFTVQDAYPVGDYWLHALARAVLHPRSEDERMAAISCAERPRTDTELLYNDLIDGHYRFLQCQDGDRIGRFIADDSESVRIQGQLSDIACMTPKALFMQYRYVGRYAEDLIFGIRLIRDGYKVGLLSSVRVIHSHHRTPSYHLRRVFVDVLFLSEVFPDTYVPVEVGLTGATAAAYDLQTLASAWRPEAFSSALLALDALIVRVVDYRLPVRVGAVQGDGFGFAPLAAWLEARSRPSGSAGEPLSPFEKAGAEQLRNIFSDRLHTCRRFIERVYAGMDDRIAAELRSLADKSLAMSVGVQLAYSYLAEQTRGGSELAELKAMLLEGV